MALFKSGNPALREKAFEGTVLQGIHTGMEMTVRGTMNKFGFLFLMLMGSTIFSWGEYYRGSNPVPLIMTGVIGGFVLGLVMTFKKEWSPYIAPGFALMEGLFVGSISAFFDHAFQESYPGLVMQAVALTLVVALVMFLLYNFRVIRVTQKLRSVIMIGTISIGVFYLIKFVSFYFFGFTLGAFTNASTPLGIGFSVVVVCLAALNLLLDFDMIEKGAASGAPKFMEWYGAYGLLVTLVWLYLEILRLLSKLRD